MSALTPETLKKIDHWIGKFPPEQKRSAVIQSLTAAQDQNGGWLSKELITDVATYLDIPAAWAYEVASFYSLFHLEPCGRNKVALCTNISCWLRGANDLAQHLEQKLGVEMGETTEDGRITLVQEEECLAGCVGAPMMIVNGHYHENLDPSKVDEILDGLT
ncbi:MAG: NADH-quinone oxidoreductase subunit NuoE [Lysobacterales bacterium]